MQDKKLFQLNDYRKKEFKVKSVTFHAPAIVDEFGNHFSPTRVLVFRPFRSCEELSELFLEIDDRGGIWTEDNLNGYFIPWPCVMKIEWDESVE